MEAFVHPGRSKQGWVYREVLEAEELATAAVTTPTEDAAAERQGETVDSDATTSEEAPSTAESATEALDELEGGASASQAAPTTAESAHERQGETVVSDASTSGWHAPTAAREAGQTGDSLAGRRVGRTRKARIARVAKPQGPLWTVHSREVTEPRQWGVYEGRRPSDQWQPTWRSRSGNAG